MRYILDNSETVNGFDYRNTLLIKEGKDSVSIIANISIGRDGESLDNNYTCINLSKKELVKLRDTLIEICPKEEFE